MLRYAAVRKDFWGLVLLLTSATHMLATDHAQMHERRQRAASAFRDGILLVHANAPTDFTPDGFRQDPIFYYFTALENTVGALLAIDGRSGESWLFLPSRPPFSKLGLQPEVLPGPDATKLLAIEHVVDWSELATFLAKRASSSSHLYFVSDLSAELELPANLTRQKTPRAPLWEQIIHQRWSSFELTEADDRVYDLMAVQSAAEISSLRAAAKATVTAVMAGIHAIRPDRSQRSVEAAVEDACWNAGAHGSSFWPWAMAGENAVFPRPFFSLARYDHLNSFMHSGDLVRLDVGCEWDHYQGDLGRTIPVSGRYREDQRETWNIFVAAYHAGSKTLREGVTVDQVFDAWRSELISHRTSAKSPLAQHAIDSWSKRENIPYWQIHTINLIAGSPHGPLRAGTTIAFEPIASIDGEGFYLEDMFLITKNGADLLTPGVPYSAEEIEAAMR